MGTHDPERDPDALPEETVFDALSSPRRRYVLYYLRGADLPADVQRIAEQVAAWENDIELEAVERQQRKRVYVSLYQTHLPKLASVGAVEYNDDAGTVAPGPTIDRIDRHLAGRFPTRPWGRYYLALSVAGALAIGSAAAGMLSVPVVVVAIVAVAAVALLAVVQVLADRRRPPTIPPGAKPNGESNE